MQHAARGSPLAHLPLPCFRAACCMRSCRSDSRRSPEPQEDDRDYNCLGLQLGTGGHYSRLTLLTGLVQDVPAAAQLPAHAHSHVRGSGEGSSAETRVAHTLVLAILDELRANPSARQELRALLGGRTSEDRLLSPREAARRLGIHPKTLTRAAAAGRVGGARRVGRHWRFDPAEPVLEPPRSSSPRSPAILAPLRSRARSAAADAIRTAGSR
jgi:excisionase family DNA binding protein